MHTWSSAYLLNWDLPIERWALTKRVRGKCWSSSLILDLSSSISNVPFGRFFMVRGCTPPNWKYNRKALASGSPHLKTYSFINLGYSTLLPDVDVTRVPKKHLKSASPAVRHNGHQVTHGSLTGKFNVKMWKQFGNERYEFKKAPRVTRSKLHLIKDAEWSLCSNF